MSVHHFERYQPQEKSSESDLADNIPNGVANKKVKIVPVQIVQTKLRSNNEQPKYPKLNLRFQTPDEECSTHENASIRTVPTVTLPLSFLQQLIQQAYCNKQLRSINSVKVEKSEECKPPAVSVDEIIKEIQFQQQHFSQPQQIDESTKIQKYLLHEQMLFLQQHEQSKQIVQLYFMDNVTLLPHFWNWLSQIEVKAIEDMLILCNADTKNTQYQDIFKSLFQKVSFEFYAKHAFALVMRSSLINNKDKMDYLEQIGDIASKIAKPQEYYVFGRK